MTAKRVLISIDERLLARIDDTARRLGMTRSGFLAQSASAQMEGAGEAARPESAAALRDIDRLAKE
jgi:metal-responsive CopG/Arc/MetJ family transcriptional regulator